MKCKTLALTLLLALSSTTANSESLNGIDEVSLIFGGWSKHFTKDASWYNYNEEHNIRGVMVNNKYTLAVFENSYYRQSVLVSYNWDLWNEEFGDLRLGASVSTGLVTGYENYNEMGIAYLGGGLSIHIMPTLNIGYQLTNDLTFGADIGMFPANEGVVITSNLRLTHRF